MMSRLNLLASPFWQCAVMAVLAMVGLSLGFDVALMLTFFAVFAIATLQALKTRRVPWNFAARDLTMATHPRAFVILVAIMGLLAATNLLLLVSKLSTIAG
ncbi:hypothetical protein GRI97_10025 [Altererythrobacter xixiisoli]|uniref:Uncharacterized protein n=1 Tax=Croceibacterium xixiisoli TaxID=1476466 RepID=A0A6I4TTK9_9SPHN|nr:hypothetical protein [Croceibacterium xixiisoli]MXO99326.1 hypothetical protein [Croceibacterium xixiisoli]